MRSMSVICIWRVNTEGSALLPHATDCKIWKRRRLWSQNGLRIWLPSVHPLAQRLWLLWRRRLVPTLRALRLPMRLHHILCTATQASMSCTSSDWRHGPSQSNGGLFNRAIPRGVQRSPMFKTSELSGRNAAWASLLNCTAGTSQLACFRNVRPPIEAS